MLYPVKEKSVVILISQVSPSPSAGTIPYETEQSPSYGIVHLYEPQVTKHEEDKDSTTRPKINISPKFEELLDDGIIDEQIIDLSKEMYNVIYDSMEAKVRSVTLSAYNPVEDFEFEEWVPYLEIKVEVDSVEKLLRLWDDITDILKQHFSQEDLEKISVFLTR